MERPILFLVAEDRATLEALDADLTRRFGNDCRIVPAETPEAGLRTLAELAGGSEPVALLIADHAMRGMSGVDFLARAHELHPRARRVLLVERDYTTRNPIVPAMTLGRIDYHLVKPWSPELGLFPAISEFLADWAASRQSSFAMFHVVADPDTARAHEIRDLLTRMSQPHVCLTPTSPEGRKVLLDASPDGSRLPVVVRHDGRVLIAPSDAELVEAVGAGTKLGTEPYDVAIVGAGPAGLAAAVYAASEGLRTIILERATSGGQAAFSARIRNYPGFTWGVGGQDFAYRACEQAWLFGADMVFTQEVTALEVDGPTRILRVADGQEAQARAVVLSTGVTWRRLDIASLEALVGTGVFYGSAVAEAPAMEGLSVCVVGGGNSAGQAAQHLSRYAASVTLLIRAESAREGMSEYLVRELEETRNVTIRTGVELVDGAGKGRLESVLVREPATGRTETIPTSALFVFIGAEPHTDWLDGRVERNEDGFILTGLDLLREGKPPADWALARQPLPLETSVPGVYAVGDVRFGSVKRVASAIGEGAMSVQMIHRYLTETEGPEQAPDPSLQAVATAPAAGHS